jgi:phospholipase C
LEENLPDYTPGLPYTQCCRNGLQVSERFAAAFAKTELTQYSSLRQTLATRAFYHNQVRGPRARIPAVGAACGLGDRHRPNAAPLHGRTGATANRIKHLVIIFQENVSLQHRHGDER